MKVTSFYPVLMSADVTAAAKFYQEKLGFKVTFESDWYVSLILDTFELAILDYDHETIPNNYRTQPQGMILNLEVDDIDSIHRRLSSENIEILQPLRDEAFGQRHFVLAAPDDVLLDIIQPIPPSDEFLSAYTEK